MYYIVIKYNFNENVFVYPCINKDTAKAHIRAICKNCNHEKIGSHIHRTYRGGSDEIYLVEGSDESTIVKAQRCYKHEEDTTETFSL